MRFSLEDACPAVDFRDPAHGVFRALADVPDFRKARGRQFDIGGMLALIVPGLAAGRLNFAAIAAFGKRREDDLVPMLGPPRAPSHKTVRRTASAKRATVAP